MNKVILLLLTISLGLLSSCCGCRGAKSRNPYNLNSNKWQLVEMNRNKIESTGDSFSILFEKEENKVTGTGDCNNFFSTYETSGLNGLKINGGGMTRMFCPNQNVEDEYMKTLNGIDSYSVDGDTLLLIKDGEVALIFSVMQGE